MEEPNRALSFLPLFFLYTRRGNWTFLKERRGKGKNVVVALSNRGIPEIFMPSRLSAASDKSVFSSKTCHFRNIIL